MLHDLLEHARRRFPENVAVMSNTGNLSYAELARRRDRLASLLARMGCGDGQLVGIYMDKTPNAVAAIFGVLACGAGYVPLDTMLPAQRVTQLAKDAGLRCVLADGVPPVQGIEVVRPAPDGEWIHASARDVEPAGPAAHSRSQESIAYVLYTSGSTGRPKGVALSHRNAEVFVHWARDYFKVSERDVLVSHAPFSFDLSVFDIFVTVAAGAAVYLLPRGVSVFPASVAQIICDKGITIWYSVPTVLADLARSGELKRVNASSLTRVIYAGEPFPIAALRLLTAQLPGAAFYNLYGPTETNVITHHALERGAGVPDEIPIGRACPYADIRVVDPRNQQVSVGEIGELVVRGDSLMQGYLNQPEVTAEAVRVIELPGETPHAYYFTGDRVRVRADGEYEFVGRCDSQVKVDGFRIELGEIERLLSDHGSVKECVVLSVEGPGHRRRLEAWVGVGKADISADELRRYLRGRLPDYMIPKRFEVLERLPRTAHGKLDRRRAAGGSA